MSLLSEISHGNWMKGIGWSCWLQWSELQEFIWPVFLSALQLPKVFGCFYIFTLPPVKMRDSFLPLRSRSSSLLLSLKFPQTFWIHRWQSMRAGRRPSASFVLHARYYDRHIVYINKPSMVSHLWTYLCWPYREWSSWGARIYVENKPFKKMPVSHDFVVREGHTFIQLAVHSTPNIDLLMSLWVAVGIWVAKEMKLSQDYPCMWSAYNVSGDGTMSCHVDRFICVHQTIV